MKKRFMPLTLASLLVCSLLCTSAFANNKDAGTEPAVSKVDTAALFSAIESSDVQMASALEKQAGAVVIVPDTAQCSRLSDVATSNALQAGSTVEQVANYIPIGNTSAKGNLATGRMLTYRTLSMTEGQTVTINIDYTPVSSEMRVGLKDSSGVVGYETVSDGFGTATFDIDKDGIYSIYVENSSPVSVHFNVSYILD